MAGEEVHRSSSSIHSNSNISPVLAPSWEEAEEVGEGTYKALSQRMLTFPPMTTLWLGSTPQTIPTRT